MEHEPTGELVALCEALVGGRATAALVASLKDESEDTLKKFLWGDNSAAITLATGEGQGSWRTRHLRIRAAILRAALSNGEWELDHLSGKELVADSFTKVVDGLAFERALQDLGIKMIRTQPAETRGGGEHSQAKLALLLGTSMVAGASAAGEIDKDDDLYCLWICGLILMCVGAVYVGSKMYRSGVWLWQRLQGTSGGRVRELDGRSGESMPMVRMFQRDDDDEWERCTEGFPQHGPETETVEISGLQDMMQ